MKKLLFLLLLISGMVSSQIQVIHFNASWNGANDVGWVEELTDCKIKKVDITSKGKMINPMKI